MFHFLFTLSLSNCLLQQLLKILSVISRDQKKNIICTMDDVRGNFLGPAHGTPPAAVIGNKNIYEIL